MTRMIVWKAKNFSLEFSIYWPAANDLKFGEEKSEEKKVERFKLAKDR